MSWNTHIPKFRRFVLQSFPFIEEDFDALTDYELICKVVEYLNNVIQSQNGVIAEVESFETNITNNFNRLENLFVELKSYVDNYFENLDVQEEINNKLDAMVEAGTLQEIVSAYLNSRALFGFDTVADMKNATNLIDGSFARTLGFHTKNDNGGATYKIRNITNDDVVDEATIIELNDSTDQLIAELIFDEIVSPEQFGCYGDGEHDDSSNMNKALSFANVEGKKIYKLSSPITLNGHNLNLHELVATVTLNNESNGNNPVKVNIDKADILILQDFKNSDFYLGKITTLNLTATTSDNAFAYNTIQGGQFNNLYIYGNSTSAWVNENVFYNVRIIYNLSIIGTGYAHNHNKFYDVVCEDGTVITLTKTYCNYISYRGETNPTINISDDNLTFGNILFRTWASFEGGYVNQTEEITNNNILLKADTAYLKAYPMYSATVDSTTNTIALSNYQTLKTFILDPSKGGCVKFRSDSPTFRIRVTPLDENNNTFNDDPHAIIQVATPWNNTNKYYWQTMNRNYCDFTINSKTIAKKIKVEIYNYTAGNAGFVNMTYYGLDPCISTVE